jgi:hypothetical protein
MSSPFPIFRTCHDEFHLIITTFIVVGRSEDGEGIVGEGAVVQTGGGAGVWQRGPM